MLYVHVPVHQLVFLFQVGLIALNVIGDDLDPNGPVSIPRHVHVMNIAYRESASWVFCSADELVS